MTPGLATISEATILVKNDVVHGIGSDSLLISSNKKMGLSSGKNVILFD
jgi:hypothetical protein